ncbi:MAG: synthase subunit alpha [Hydrocarboniphaga sp.]|uniref:F0F1 ATP synthase subunit alpha n=1 Tax=Hydrocarboniphaga sp. TaxID=2033016 RepID=UPI0026287899|nr:F0F1 ATP synthase subunit alpha [Hydrocarboniphaga sp.]MDB5972267.1 synthase subunit alpha [Hydrocarboniphaga sp.]
MNLTPLPEALDRWLPGAQARVERVALLPRVDVFGRVESFADGVAHVSGLAQACLGEQLAFDGGGTGYVLSLESDLLSCVLLDAPGALGAGCRVSGSGRTVQVPVGDALLGRVIDPLGRALDAGPPIVPECWLPIERPSPAIHERDLVQQPVHTGTLAIDAMFALGRGQRELIIGDGATGKTAIATDTIIQQKHSELICIYVSIGQTASSTARVIDAVRRFGAPERCIFVVAESSGAPGLQWIAPFAAFTMAEHFRDRGQHVLVVIDDLSKHAATHRELALLTRQPPGREAYPGDVFYVHARLLERAAQLSAARGGGSLTALPIAETQAGNLSAYIPTNLISITDGQIVLDRRLFDANHKPAIDTGLSVSRIGGKTQTRAMREAVGTLRLDYAQFVELEMFTRFGTSVEPRIQARLARGRQIRALLKQPQHAPLPAPQELALLHLLGSGVLDSLPADAMQRLREALPQWLEGEGAEFAAAVDRGDSIAPPLLQKSLAQLGKLSAPAP